MVSSHPLCSTDVVILFQTAAQVHVGVNHRYHQRIFFSYGAHNTYYAILTYHSHIHLYAIARTFVDSQIVVLLVGANIYHFGWNILPIQMRIDILAIAF